MAFLHKIFLLLVCTLIVFSQSLQTTQTSQTFVTSGLNVNNGGLEVAFPIGPNNLNIPGVATNSFYLFLPSGVTSTLNLAIGLLNNDYQIYPLTGFDYSYRLEGAPNWINYNAGDRSISISAFSSASPVQFNITYSDARNNSARIPVTIAQSNPIGFNLNQNQLDFITTDYVYNPNANTYTLIFPLFTTTNSSLNSIRVNSYGALTNVATKPWTYLIPVYRQTITNTNTGFPILNTATGTGTGTTIISSNTTSSTTNPNLVTNTNTVSTPTVITPVVTNPVITPLVTNPNTTTSTTTWQTFVPGQTISNPNNNFIFSTPNNPGTAVFNSTSTSATNTTSFNPSPSANIPTIIPIITTPSANVVSPTVVNPSVVGSTTVPSATSTAGSTGVFNSTTTTTTTTIGPVNATSAILNNLNNSVAAIPVNSVSPIPVSNFGSGGFSSSGFSSSGFSSSGSPVVTVSPSTQTVDFVNGSTIVRTTNQTTITGTPQQISQLINGTVVGGSGTVSPVISTTHAR